MFTFVFLNSVAFAQPLCRGVHVTADGDHPTPVGEASGALTYNDDYPVMWTAEFADAAATLRLTLYTTGTRAEFFGTPTSVVFLDDDGLVIPLAARTAAEGRSAYGELTRWTVEVVLDATTLDDLSAGSLSEVMVTLPVGIVGVRFDAGSRTPLVRTLACFASLLG